MTVDTRPPGQRQHLPTREATMTFVRHCDSCGEPAAAPHVFTAQETDPSGIRVTVTITVPQDAFWKTLREVTEFAQMTASRAMSSTLTSRQQAHEEVPF